MSGRFAFSKAPKLLAPQTASVTSPATARRELLEEQHCASEGGESWARTNGPPPRLCVCLLHVVKVSQVAAAFAVALLRAQLPRARVGPVARGTVAVNALPIHAQNHSRGAATTAPSQVSAQLLREEIRVLIRVQHPTDALRPAKGHAATVRRLQNQRETAAGQHRDVAHVELYSQTAEKSCPLSPSRLQLPVPLRREGLRKVLRDCARGVL